MFKKNPNIKLNFTRDELLGFSSKIFSLNQAEYVAKKMIDQIIFKTFEKVRMINVKGMDKEYATYASINKLQNIVSLGLLQPEIEYEKEINFNINFDIKPAIIDSWAGNQTKILNTVPQEEIPTLPIRKVEKSDDKSKNSANDLPSKRGGKKKTISPIKKITKKPPQNEEKKKKSVIELPIESKPIKEEPKPQLNELDQMKLDGYRVYFQEREIERKKRAILEHEQFERKKEEEKNIKKVLEMMEKATLLSWDMDGDFCR